MSEIDNTDEFEVAQEDEQVDEITEDLSEGTDVQEESVEDSEDWKARALKAEAILKRKQKKEAEPPKPAQEINQPQPTTDAVTPEDLLRTTKGYDDETLAQLKVIAKGKEISLFKAEEDPLFATYLEKKQADEKSAKAKLGASNSSGKTGSKKSFTSPGLSPEEHKAMWKEKMGL